MIKNSHEKLKTLGLMLSYPSAQLSPFKYMQWTKLFSCLHYDLRTLKTNHSETVKFSHGFSLSLSHTHTHEHEHVGTATREKKLILFNLRWKEINP